MKVKEKTIVVTGGGNGLGRELVLLLLEKAAVKSLSEGLSAELSDTGAHVSVVFPGAMFTDIKSNSGLGAMSQEDKEKSKTVLHPRRAAEIIVRGIERNRKRIYVGNDAKTMNFLYRLTPGFAVKMIYKKIQHNF
jgi:short-subunit dehydrogenase